MHTVFALLLVSAPALAANTVTPGIDVREVSAPPTLVTGVRRLAVGPFEGPNGTKLQAEIVAGLGDPDRDDGTGTASELAGDVIKMGSEVGGALLANQVGGGTGGKILKGATEAAGEMVADKVSGEKHQLDDGLSIQPFEVVTSDADGTCPHVKVPAQMTASKDPSSNSNLSVKSHKLSDL